MASLNLRIASKSSEIISIVRNVHEVAWTKIMQCNYMRVQLCGDTQYAEANRLLNFVASMTPTPYGLVLSPF